MTDQAGRNRGGPPASPVLRRLVDLLDDGEWHDYERVIREAGKAIPPGIARRKTEKVRRGAQRNPPDERKRPMSDERQIESGRRTIVRQAMRPPFFAVDDSGERRRVRLAQVPPRIVRDRESERAGALVDPARVIETARAGDDVTFLLSDLTQPALLRVTLALVDELSRSGR